MRFFNLKAIFAFAIGTLIVSVTLWLILEWIIMEIAK